MGDVSSPASTCYRCEHPYGGLVRTEGRDHEPLEGDLALCPSCGAVAIFTGEGYLARRPTPAEVKEILADPDVIYRVGQIHDARRLAIAEGRGRRAQELRRQRSRWN